MRGLSHPGRILWLFGLVLLLGTAAGAGWMLNHTNASSEAPAKPAKDKALPFDGKFIIAFGYVDVRPGVTKIYPLVSGKVEWVAEEGATVPKGGELLRLEDELARSDVKKAEIAVSDAQEVLKEAKKLTEKQDLSLAAQQAAIDVALAKKQAGESQVAKLKDLLSKKIGGNDFDLKSAEAQVREVEAAIKAEQNKLAMLKLFGPEDKIKRAELDVDFKQQLLKHAKLGLKEYTVLAPVDGTVLRTFASIGETLGPNPKSPAIEFCPSKDLKTGKPLARIIRTEVQQEWADRLKLNQEALIEDDSNTGYQWKGKVIHISDWFTHRRSIIQEPFQFNDVRTLECIIEITSEPPGQPLRIGQRMRVMINQGGP